MVQDKQFDLFYTRKTTSTISLFCKQKYYIKWQRKGMSILCVPKLKRLALTALPILRFFIMADFQPHLPMNAYINTKTHNTPVHSATAFAIHLLFNEIYDNSIQT